MVVMVFVHTEVLRQLLVVHDVAVGMVLMTVVVIRLN